MLNLYERRFYQKQSSYQTQNLVSFGEQFSHTAENLANLTIKGKETSPNGTKKLSQIAKTA